MTALRSIPNSAARAVEAANQPRTDAQAQRDLRHATAAELRLGRTIFYKAGDDKWHAAVLINNDNPASIGIAYANQGRIITTDLPPLALRVRRQRGDR